MALAMLFVATLSLGQTIRRVNNNEGITGTNVYRTIQEAHDAAANGDIILVEPSRTSYGDLLCSKRLTIYGNGYWLDYNGGTSKSNPNPTLLGTVDFAPGSSGSEISGFQTGDINVRAVSGIKVNRNHTWAFNVYAKFVSGVGPTEYADVSDITFTQNYCTGGVLVLGEDFGDIYTISDLTISNNYLWSFIEATFHVWNGIFRNNTINEVVIVRIANSIFENNILLAIANETDAFDVTPPETGSFYAISSSLNYNASTYHLFPGSVGTGNQNELDPAAHFVTPTSGASSDALFKLKEDSSLRTAGSGGTEIGMYGGATPYIVSGIPPIPAITNLKTTGTGSAAVPLTVTFSAKSY